MPTYSVGEALSLLLEKSKWKPKVHELRMRQEWEQITGKTIARYTRSLALADKRLTIFTDVAALKQELMLGKEQLIATINKYFEETVVTGDTSALKQCLQYATAERRPQHSAV